MENIEIKVDLLENKTILYIQRQFINRFLNFSLGIWNGLKKNILSYRW